MTQKGSLNEADTKRDVDKAASSKSTDGQIDIQKSDQNGDDTDGLLANLLDVSSTVFQQFERFGCRFSTFGTAYQQLFYSHLIERELRVLELDDDASILQIGCGPYPMTAMTLAERGYNVVAIDNDADAIEAAKKTVLDRGLADKITILRQDGRTTDVSPFDVVWLAFHVHPKDRLVRQILSELRSGQTLIYRRPRSWAQLLFSTDDHPEPTVSFARIKQLFGKESVVVCTGPAGCEGCVDVDACPAARIDEPKTDADSSGSPTSTGPTLDSLEVGQAAIIETVPDHDLLPPLGVRPGKSVCLQTGQMFDGPLILAVGGRTVALDRRLAGQIRVDPVLEAEQETAERVTAEVR